MANWFCSVFNVVCVVDVCPVHPVVHRPWTKMHKQRNKKRNSTVLIGSFSRRFLEKLKSFNLIAAIFIAIFSASIFEKLFCACGAPQKVAARDFHRLVEIQLYALPTIYQPTKFKQRKNSRLSRIILFRCLKTKSRIAVHRTQKQQTNSGNASENNINSHRPSSFNS